MASQMDTKKNSVWKIISKGLGISEKWQDWPRRTLLYRNNLPIHLILFCVTFFFPQTRGYHQGEPFWKRGDHQNGGNDGTVGYPRRILRAVHRTVREKDGEFRKTYYKITANWNTETRMNWNNFVTKNKIVNGIDVYILSSADRLFRCIITLQCGLTRRTLQAEFETRPTLRIILLSHQSTYISSGIIRHYVVAFVCLDFALPDTRVFNS